MKYVVLILLLGAVIGCSSPNKLHRIVNDETIIKMKGDESDRYSNLYSGEQHYPVTCEKNCYPPSPSVQCKTEAENCVFVGEQVKPSVNAGFEITWFGHASFAIGTSTGERFLFDPVSQQFDWPVNWAFKLSAGFNRNEPNSLGQQELQNADAVMYSHIHYDHFNKSDIKMVQKNAKFLVPLGFAEHFEAGNHQITEMAWYGMTRVGQTDIHFVPAHHFSSRIWIPYLYEDADKTLWGGWVLEHKGKKLFFAGDTGYSPHFKDIYNKYGAMDVCLLPIASYYHPEHGKWYRNVHTTPEDSLEAAKDLNCKVTIPWGYGNNSWKMGDHSSHSALLRFLHMHKELNEEVPIYILNEGNTVVF